MEACNESFDAKGRGQRISRATNATPSRYRIDTAAPDAYIDRAESIERRSATFEEETATERGASDDRH